MCRRASVWRYWANFQVQADGGRDLRLNRGLLTHFIRRTTQCRIDSDFQFFHRRAHTISKKAGDFQQFCARKARQRFRTIKLAFRRDRYSSFAIQKLMSAPVMTKIAKVWFSRFRARAAERTSQGGLQPEDLHELELAAGILAAIL